jgi:hypothetical protein
MEFDFDTWSALAQSDRAEFERRRQALLEAAIASASPELQPRLRALQWRIDVERERAATPLAACIKLSSMMWESFYELHAALNGAAPARRSSRSATILPFQPKNAKTESA